MSETITIPEILIPNKEESMTTQDLLKEKEEKIEKIVVIGIGGAGNNAVQYLYEQKEYLNTVGKSVNHFVLNTDENCLRAMSCESKIILGPKKCKGKGAGANINVGKEATMESINDIKEICNGADLVFLAAGMGGGTGTLGASVVANAAHEQGAIVVSLVTLPFRYENRLKAALSGVKELFKFSDSLILIDNQKIVEFYPDLEFSQGLDKANEILSNAISGVIKIIHNPSKINTDFEDLKTILHSGGKSQILYNQLDGEEINNLTADPDPAIELIYEKVTNSPLVAKSDIKKASSFLMLFECTHHFTQKIIDKLVQKFSNPENKQTNNSYEDFLDNLDAFNDDFDFPEDDEDLPKVIFAYNKIEADEQDNPKIIVTIVATGMDNKKVNEATDKKEQIPVPISELNKQTKSNQPIVKTEEPEHTFESVKTVNNEPKEVSSNNAIEDLDVEKLFQSLSDLDKIGMLPASLQEKYEELKLQIALNKLKASNSAMNENKVSGKVITSQSTQKSQESNSDFDSNIPKVPNILQFNHSENFKNNFNVEKSPNTPVDNGNSIYTKETHRKEPSESHKNFQTFSDTDIGIDE